MLSCCAAAVAARAPRRRSERAACIADRLGVAEGVRLVSQRRAGQSGRPYMSCDLLAGLGGQARQSADAAPLPLPHINTRSGGGQRGRSHTNGAPRGRADAGTEAQQQTRSADTQLRRSGAGVHGANDAAHGRTSLDRRGRCRYAQPLRSEPPSRRMARRRAADAAAAEQATSVPSRAAGLERSAPLARQRRSTRPRRRASHLRRRGACISALPPTPRGHRAAAAPRHPAGIH
jgi:hypothetical protein